MIPSFIQNDSQIPALGFGTWALRDELAMDMVGAAIDAGYRHIDTAQMYDNEVEVGKAINQSVIAREDIFLTTKIGKENLAKDDFLVAAQQSLEKLKQGYVDLLLIHWPNRNIPIEETLEALAETQTRGYARNIGVSNFPIALLKKCLEVGIHPMTNQVEYHPFLDQSKLLGYMKQNDILLTAYSPIAQGKVIGNARLKQLGEKYGKHETQISLRWLIQQGVIAIPRTSKIKNLKANSDLFDFELTETEMNQINALGSAEGRLVNPKDGPAWD